MQITWSSFHRFTEESVRKHVPKESGIYLLWVQLENNKWRCFYVGQTVDLEGSLIEHLSDNESNACVKQKVHELICGYEYVLIDYRISRDRIEKFLYDFFGPECNTSDPGGEAIEVNLPRSL